MTALERPWSFQEFEAPRCHDYRQMNVISLSAVPYFSYFKNINENFNRLRYSTGLVLKISKKRTNFLVLCLSNKWTFTILLLETVALLVVVLNKIAWNKIKIFLPFLSWKHFTHVLTPSLIREWWMHSIQNVIAWLREMRISPGCQCRWRPRPRLSIHNSAHSSLLTTF